MSCWQKVNLWSKSLALLSKLYFIQFLASSQLWFLFWIGFGFFGGEAWVGVAFYSKVYQGFCLYSQFSLSEKTQPTETCWFFS